MWLRTTGIRRYKERQLQLGLRAASSGPKEGCVMTTYADQPTAGLTESHAADSAVTDAQGVIAGLLGAAVVALWFLGIDAVQGRPLFTPTVLGTAVFRGGEGLGSPETLPVSLEMAFLFTWIHCLVFIIIGVVAGRLLNYAEHHADVGFGIILLFVIFEFGFVAVASVLAEGVLQALTWPAILFGNLLAAAAMGAYFWRRHPNLEIRP
jgi:hypothetical protein